MAKTAKIARKKNVDNSLAYEFSVKQKDILERVHFGSFEVLITTKGAMFKNYSGFHVFTSPYAVGVDGKAVENSLYRWLVNLVNTHKALADKLDEQFDEQTYDDGRPLLNRDIYDLDKIITEANLIKPMTAFIDVNKATEEAKEYMNWLTTMQEELSEAMAQQPASEEEAMKADVEEAFKMQQAETMTQMIEEADDAK